MTYKQLKIFQKESVSDIELICGDCTEQLKEINESSIDLTVTSPPYDNMRTYKGNNDHWGEHVWKSVIRELFRVTKEGGVVVWVVGDATIKSSETGTSFKQALWARECGFNVETMIWEKTGSGNMGSRFFYAQNFEYMFVFAKGKPSTRNLIKDRPNKIKSGTVKVNGVIKNTGESKQSRVIERKPFGKRTNIWRINPQQNSKHPAPFPEALVNDHILSWSNEGHTVLDPFMGSGTTGKMAKKLNRNFIGIELDKEYFKLAEKRMDE